MAEFTLPSLYDSPVRETAANADKRPKQTLLDIFYEGFLMLIMLKHSHQPQDADEFTRKINEFFVRAGSEAKNIGVSDQDITEAKYAFCAMLDEIVLNSNYAIHDIWTLRSLQLTNFGDQRAGVNFFRRLEILRETGPATHLQTIEIYYMCLLLGFKGMYAFQEDEKREKFIEKLGIEIQTLRGKAVGFAPHAMAPDRISHALKNNLPVWSVAFLFVAIGVLTFLGFHYLIGKDSQTMLTHYQHLIEVGQRPAHLTITLP